MLPKNPSPSTVATYALLGTAAVTAFLLPESLVIPQATAASGPATVRLNGVVRDFLESHDDFDAVPAGGYGHYAGSVNHALGGDGRPVFTAPGVNQGGGTDDIYLIAHWTFDDGGGAVADDAVGTNDGALVNGPTWAAGHIGSGALHFDGSNDIVEIPSSPEMQITGDITFAGWFKLDADFNSGVPTQVIMEKFLDANHDFHIGLAGADYNRPEVAKGSLVFKVEHGPTSDYYCYAWTNQTSWTAGTWYHFACVVNSGDVSQNKIYIDGVDDTSIDMAIGIGFTDTDFDAPMRIGGKTIYYNGLATDIFFDGVIDDVMIFSRVLSDGDFGTSGTGFKVDDQWTERNANPIAPHMYQEPVPGVTGVYTSGTMTLDSDGVFDSFDSELGGYGGANSGGTVAMATTSTASNAIEISSDVTVTGDVLVGVGGDPATGIDNSGTITGTTGTLSSPFSMPTVVAPTDAVVGPNLGSGTYEGGGSFTINSNKHFDDLIIKTNATVTIDGNVTILVEGNFKSETGGALQLTPGSTLDLYIKGKVEIKTNSAWSDPAGVTMWVIGSPQIKIETKAIFCGTIVAPDATLLLKTEAALYGTFIGAGIEVLTGASVHFDRDLMPEGMTDACGTALADSKGTAGVDGSGGIDSAESFAAWFRDTMGTNLSIHHAITLTDNGSGVYEHLTGAFHPIDNRLFGNEGAAHNFHLTYAFDAGFVYESCVDQFFEFEGADNAWVFIDGQLVIDLGGVLPGTGQFIDLDRLDLTDGESYLLQFFYAQRQETNATFRMRTNLQLNGPTTVAAGGASD